MGENHFTRALLRRSNEILNTLDMSQTSLTANHSPTSRRVSLIIWCAFFLWAFLLFVPFDALVVPVGTLDHAWMLALHAEHAARARFGIDVIFTYGPAGFLLAPVYFPSTYLLLLLWRAIFIVILFACLFQILRQCRFSPLAAFVQLAVLTVCLACERTEWNQDPLPMALAVCILILHFFLPRRCIFLTCTALAALPVMGIAKQSYLPIAVLLVSAICIDCLFRHDFRNLLLIAVSLFIGWWLGWCVIGGQQWADFFHFLAVSAVVVRGYVEAMAYSIPPASARTARLLQPRTEQLLTAAFAANCVLVGIVAVLAQWGAAWRQWIGIAALFVLIAFAFKAGCMRPDVAHTGSGAAAMLCMIVICSAPLNWLRRKFTRLLVIIPSLFFFALFLVSASRSVPVLTHTFPIFLSQKTASSARAAVELLMHGDRWQQVRYDAAIAEARASVSPFQLGGHVEVYPSDLMLAIALSKPFIPRPALQSYAAFNELLETADADYLLSSIAPPRILFRIDATDGRFPATDDALSWPLLLSRYAYEGNAGDYLALARRSDALAFSRKLITRENISFDQWFNLPNESSLTWAKMKISQSLFGQAFGTLAHPSSPLLEIRLQDGRILQYRLNRDQAASGFLMSPFISTTNDFRSLIQQVQSQPGSIHPNQVKCFRLVTGDRFDSTEFSPHYDLELDQLVFSKATLP